MISKHSINVTTDSGGAFDDTTSVPVFGELMAILYTPDGTSPLDTGADIVVTGKQSALPIVTKANIGTSAFVMAPRQATHAVGDGAALLYAAGGAPVTDRIVIAGESIRLVVANGGNALKGRFDFFMKDAD